MQNYIGQQIDRYHITERLGMGGMAVVYKAYDTRLERDVAVKVLRMDIFGTAVHERLLKRFKRESKALAKLDHPNIIKIIDFGTCRDSPYLVMPYIIGNTLKARIGKPLRWQDAVMLVTPIADALAYAHTNGLVHRDVKPSNILLGEKNKPILTDFGIAKLLETDESHQTLTGTGVGLGTPEYMAPEQGLGKKIDGRADVYALGVVMYELLTGAKPFKADTPMAVLIKQINDPLPKIDRKALGIPGRLCLAVTKAMAKDPADRYKDMAYFCQTLTKFSKQIEKQVQPSEMVIKPENKGKAPKIPTQIPNHDDFPTIDKALIDPEQFEVNSLGCKPKNKINRIKKLKPTPNLLKWLGVAFLVIVVLAGTFGLIISLFENSLTGLAEITIPTIASTEIYSTPAKTETLIPSNTPMTMITSLPESTPTPTLGVGSTMINQKNFARMVYVPAGDFLMGSNGGINNEQPESIVYLDAFWIYELEVSNKQFDICIETNNCEPTYDYENRRKQGNNFDQEKITWNYLVMNYPVVDIDWYQAKAYCEWTGGRLPTEAEWEKAARGVDGRTYPWGNEEPSCRLANYKNCNDLQSSSALPVKSHIPGRSPYGALNMAGNVWEWVSDWYAWDYYSQKPRENPTGPELGTSKVLRGGAWNNNVDLLRITHRRDIDPLYHSNSIGFRCVHSEPPNVSP
jgi:eukaryotic-like serine/threonine-protein kinase